MKKIFKVNGMTCNSCAKRIENALEDKGIKSSVNFAKEEAEVEFNPEKISENEIKKIIEKEGYQIIENKKSEKKNYFGWVIVSASLILLIFVLYKLLGGINIPNIQVPEIGEKSSLILLFLVGILTGFHCVSMCGGFVVSYTAKNAIRGHKSFKQHLIYGGAKVFSYALIGGIFGLIGGIFAFSVGLRGFVAIFAGLFMILYSLSMMGIKFFRRFQFNPKFLSRIASKQHEGYYSGPFFTGLLSGLFIACGPLQAMYLYAMGSGGFFNGASSLAAFGLGTLPIMLGFGSLTTVISHKTTKRILKFSAIIVLILGLIMLNRGLTLTGSSWNYDSIKAKIIGGEKISNESNSVLVDGKQEINMVVDAYGYSPNSFVLKKGIPVRWNVNVKQLTGCNRELVMSKYNIDVKLKEGLNEIEFTPTEEGTFSFSCGMGMLRGNFIITETGTASKEQINANAVAKGGSCSMGTGGGGCGCGM